MEVVPLAVALLRPTKGERRFVVIGRSDDDRMIEFPVQSGDIVIIDEYSVIHDEKLTSKLPCLGSSLEEMGKKVHGSNQFGLGITLHISESSKEHDSAEARPIMGAPQMCVPEKTNSSNKDMVRGRAAWFKKAKGKWKAHHHSESDNSRRNQLQFVERIIMSSGTPSQREEKMIYRHTNMGCEITPFTALMLDGLAFQGIGVARDRMGMRMATPIISKQVLQLSAEDGEIPMISDGIIVHLAAKVVLTRSYGLPPLSVVVLRSSSEDGFEVMARSEDDRLVEVKVKFGDIVLIGNYWILQDDALFSKVKQSGSLEELCLKSHPDKLGICAALRIGRGLGADDDLGSTNLNDAEISEDTDLTNVDLLKVWFSKKFTPTPAMKFGDLNSLFSEGVLVGKQAMQTKGGLSRGFAKFGIRTSRSFLFVSDGLILRGKKGNYLGSDTKMKIDKEMLRSVEKFKTKFPLNKHGIMVAIDERRLMVRLFGNPPLTVVVLRRETEGYGKVLVSGLDRYEETVAEDGDLVLIVSNDIMINDVITEFSKDMCGNLEVVCKELFEKYGNQRGMILASRIGGLELKGGVFESDLL